MTALDQSRIALALERVRDLPDDELVDAFLELEKERDAVLQNYGTAAGEVMRRLGGDAGVLGDYVGEVKYGSTRYEWDDEAVRAVNPALAEYEPETTIPGRYVVNTRKANAFIEKAGKDIAEKLKAARRVQRSSPRVTLSRVIDSRFE